MKKGKLIGYLVGILVIVVLIFGIVSIARKGSSGEKKEAKKQTTKTVDNSVKLTNLTVTAPEPAVTRAGEELQLDIQTEPAKATNKKLKWTINGKSKGIKVTKDGMLTLADSYAKQDVTLVASSTDGSKLTSEVKLKVYPKIDPSKPMVAVTFDDGPNPSTTNKMLDTLEQNYAKATFFVLGQNAKYYPETVKREYDLGMEVGTHTYSHVVLTNLGQGQLNTEVEKSVDAIVKAIGVKPNLMRPPYGAVNKSVLKTVGSYDLCCMNWSLDTEDWKYKSADATYKAAMTAKDGDVILLHDIHDYNIDAVKRFVPDLIAEGFQLVTVPELYAARGETLDPGTVHFRTDPTTEASNETTAAQEGDSATASEASTGEETSTTSVDDSSEDTTETSTETSEDTSESSTATTAVFDSTKATN